MTNHKPPTAAILIIGDEILSGRTLDTNSQYIAKTLTNLGIYLKEIRTVADERAAIISHIRVLSELYTYVFTTGGIGPTHDDITSSCMAEAFGRKLARHPDAYAALVAYHGEEHMNAARSRMADVPEGVRLLENPISGAPGFQIENVYVMAGVPGIMKVMMDAVAPTLIGGKRLECTTVSCDIPEGDMAASFEAILAAHQTVVIGSYPFARNGVFGTEVVFRSIDAESVKDASDMLLRAYPKVCTRLPEKS